MTTIHLGDCQNGCAQCAQNCNCENCKNLGTISMREITRELKARGIEATYSMSGGGCGTIYLGSVDSEGYYQMAVGPSNYYDDQATWSELCWGVDGAESATYAHKIIARDEFTPKVVASCIALQFNYCFTI